MSAVAERLLSLDEFYREYEGRRAYLIDGVPYLMAPAGQLHADSVVWLSDVLRAIAPDGTQVREEKPHETGGANDPEPDILLVRREPGGVPGRHPEAADTLLVVEVSDSSLAKDRSRKLPRYAESGIPEVWVVNLLAGEVEVHRKPAGGRYADTSVVRRGQAISPLFAPDARVIVGDWAGSQSK